MILVAGALLFGCTPATHPTTQNEPPLGPIPTITSPEQVVLPIYSYLPSVEQTVALMLSGQQLMNQCFQANGTDEESELFIVDGATGEETIASQGDLMEYVSNLRRRDVTYSGMWQFFNPDAIPNYGYTLSPLDNESLAAPTGLPPGGEVTAESCFARVNSVSPAKSALFPFTISDLPDGGPQWHVSDSRYIAVEGEWSRCMQTFGFSYNTPEDAMIANVYPETETLKAQGEAVAKADVQCKIDTNLVGIAVGIQSAYEQDYIDSHRDQLSAQQQEISDFLAGKVSVPDIAPAVYAPSSSPS